MSKKEMERIIKEQTETIARLEKRIAELEAQLKMNSGNSSMPPSKDGFNKPTPKSQRVPSGKKPGGQIGHKGHGFKLPKIDEVQNISVQTCSNCNADISEIPGTITGTRYKSDIPEIVLRTTQMNQISTQCPCCGTKNKGDFPQGVSGRFQYGENLKSFIVMLAHYGMVSVERVQEIIADAFNVEISQGTIQNIIYECAKNLKEPVAEIAQKVSEAPVTNNDETGFDVNGKIHWLHVASTALYTYIHIHAMRGVAGMEAGGILPDYKGISMHDCLAGYFTFHCDHALCNAHLLRELVWVTETTNQEWADELLKLLVELKDLVEQYKAQGATHLPESIIGKYRIRFDELVAAGIELNPIPPRKEGQKGRTPKGKTRCLLDRLAEHREKYLFFARDFRVPFDNNQAERDIRIAKLKQKVSGGARTIKGATAFATITSFIQTARKHGANILNALRTAFSGASGNFMFEG